MADVFLSYVHHDRLVAADIAAGLEASGLSVWWDRHIRAGAEFAAEIDVQLKAAKAVIVLWSSRSVDSAWVRDEASFARDERKLIPVRLDEAPPPLGFRQLQTLDFDGSSTPRHIDDLVTTIRQFLAVAPTKPHAAAIVQTSNRSIRVKRRIVAGVAVAAVVATAVAILQWSDVRSALTRSPFDSGVVEIGNFELLNGGDDTVRFAKGLTDTIERALTTSGTRTVVRAASSSNIGNTAPVQGEFLLRGTIDTADGKFIVSADVVHAGEGSTLWSTTREGNATESRAFQREFSRWVASVVYCGFSRRARIDNDPSANLFSHLLRMCDAEFDEGTPPEQRVELARLFVEAAPRYAFSYGLYATVNAFLTTGVWNKLPREELERLRRLTYENIDSALAMDRDNSAALFAKAIVVDPARSTVEREQLLHKVLEVDPHFYYAELFSCILLRNVGRTREAEVWMARFINDFPFASINARSNHAFMVAGRGEIVLARELFEQISRDWPNDLQAKNLQFRAEHWFGDPAIASELARSLPIDAASMPCLNAILDARSRQAQLSERDIEVACAPGFYGRNGANAPELTYAYFGHVDAAYRALENAFDEYKDNPDRLPRLYWPTMRSVRADPRFWPFAARLGLTQYWLETDRWPDFCEAEKLSCKDAAQAVSATLVVSEP